MSRKCPSTFSPSAVRAVVSDREAEVGCRVTGPHIRPRSIVSVTAAERRSRPSAEAPLAVRIDRIDRIAARIVAQTETADATAAAVDGRSTAAPLTARRARTIAR